MNIGRFSNCWTKTLTHLQLGDFHSGKKTVPISLQSKVLELSKYLGPWEELRTMRWHWRKTSIFFWKFRFLEISFIFFWGGTTNLPWPWWQLISNISIYHGSRCHHFKEGGFFWMMLPTLNYKMVKFINQHIRNGARTSRVVQRCGIFDPWAKSRVLHGYCGNFQGSCLMAAWLRIPKYRSIYDKYLGVSMLNNDCSPCFQDKSCDLEDSGVLKRSSFRIGKYMEIPGSLAPPNATG